MSLISICMNFTYLNAEVDTHFNPWIYSLHACSVALVEELCDLDLEKIVDAKVS